MTYASHKCSDECQHDYGPTTTEEIFIGLQVCAGHAVVDTGAQHGICGEKQWEWLRQQLAVRGLKPRKVPTLGVDAVGVGGRIGFKAAYEVPVGIGGSSGLLTINIIANDIPILLPINFMV